MIEERADVRSIAHKRINDVLQQLRSVPQWTDHFTPEEKMILFNAYPLLLGKAPAVTEGPAKLSDAQCYSMLTEINVCLHDAAKPNRGGRMENPRDMAAKYKASLPSQEAKA